MIVSSIIADVCRSPNWTRAATSGELYAYVSPVGVAGSHDVQPQFWLYYTYLQVCLLACICRPCLSAHAAQPGESFSHRYPTRRAVSLLNTSGPCLVELVLLRNATDVWATTALVPRAYNYSPPQRLGFLLTQSKGRSAEDRVLWTDMR
jgi:hypothetical protein